MQALLAFVDLFQPFCSATEYVGPNERLRGCRHRATHNNTAHVTHERHTSRGSQPNTTAPDKRTRLARRQHICMCTLLADPTAPHPALHGAPYFSVRLRTPAHESGASAASPMTRSSVWQGPSPGFSSSARRISFVESPHAPPRYSSTPRSNTEKNDLSMLRCKNATLGSLPKRAFARPWEFTAAHTHHRLRQGTTTPTQTQARCEAGFGRGDVPPR